MALYDDIQVKTATHLKHEREGWVLLSEAKFGRTKTHTYYRKDDTIACVSYSTGRVFYWPVKGWMESNYR